MPLPPSYVIHLLSSSTSFPLPHPFLFHILSSSTSMPLPPSCLIHLLSSYTYFPLLPSCLLRPLASYTSLTIPPYYCMADSAPGLYLIHALISIRLDYYNSILYNLPKNSILRLQSIQNQGARILTKTPRRDHITEVLIDLHWLRIEERIVYKLLIFNF